MTDSPDFTPPQQTPPFLKAVSPNVFQIPRLRPREAQLANKLTFEVLSEDLNQTTPLSSLVILDFLGLSTPFQDNLQHFLGSIRIKPGHLLPPSGGPREVETDFRFPPGILGCHSISVIVSHQFEDVLSTKPLIKDDVAVLTWWYLLLSDSGELPADATQCTSAPDRGDDAGADAAGDGATVIP